MTALTKLEVARRQLGTALWLFLEDLDPVSVHTLTGAAAELAEELARDYGGSPFLDHIMQTNLGMTRQEYHELARVYYNAFKHLTKRNGAKRDDEALLAGFSDEKNDAMLCVGWTDLLEASPACPIEAQVFLVWFYACHPEKMARAEDVARFSSVFPGIKELPRTERKAALKEQIFAARKNPNVMAHPGTERRPLVWAAPHGCVELSGA